MADDPPNSQQSDPKLNDHDNLDITRTKAVHPTWKSLFNFTLRRHFTPLIFALCLTVFAGCVQPALAFILGRLFNVLANFAAGILDSDGLLEETRKWCFYLLGLGCLDWIFNGLYFMFWLAFGELQAKSVREQLFSAMLRKDLEWFEMRASGIGALLPRLQTQIRELQLATSQPFGFAFQYTVTILAALGLALFSSWKVTLVTLSSVPIALIILSLITAGMQPSIEKQQLELNQASKHITTAIAAIDTVKFYNGQSFEIAKYTQNIRKAATFYLRVARSNALQIGFVRFVTLAMFVQAFWYGSHLFAKGEVSAGDVLTAFWGCLIATQSAEMILPQMIVLEKGRAAGFNLKAIVDHVHRGTSVASMTGGNAPRYCEGDIEVRDVAFAYPSRPDHLVLKKSTFFFPAGEMSFVVGRSGSGKSTLGNLLMRFYAPTSGEILIDDNPIQTLDLGWLRNNITLVQQNSILFNETIFRNIAFGRQNFMKLEKSDIKAALDLANLRQTIDALPDGLETMVGAKGSSLSGGQKQRVALARARLRNTPILILDESTSALDEASRIAVINAIREWRQGRTTIVITHDMTQIRGEDYVYVMQDGQIVQEGYKTPLTASADGVFNKELMAEHRLSISPRLSKRFSSRKSQFISPELPPYEAHPPPKPIIDKRISRPLPFRDPTSESLEPVTSRIKRTSIFVPNVFGGAGSDNARHQWRARASLNPLGRLTIAPKRQSVGPNDSFMEMLNQLFGEDQPGSPYTPLPDYLSTPSNAIEMKHLHDRYMPNTPGQDSDVNSDLSTPSPRERTHLLPYPTAKDEEEEHAKTEPPCRSIMSMRQILTTVWPVIKTKHRISLIVGFIAATVHAAATPAFSFVFAQLLATFYQTTDRTQTAFKWSMSVLAVAAVDATASFLTHYLLESCAQAWVDTLRLEAAERILDQPKEWFENERENDVNSLSSILDRNAEEMRNLLGRFAGFIHIAFSMISISLIWSFVICAKLTAVGVGCTPVLYALTRCFEAVSTRWEGRSNAANEHASAIFAETFSDVKTVRSLTLESYFHKKFRRATVKAMNIGFTRAIYCGMFYGLSEATVMFITALMFYYGAVLAASHSIPVKDITEVSNMLLFGIANVQAIMGLIPQISSSRDTASQLLRLSNLPKHASHEHTGHITQIPITNEPINFNNITFAYPSRPNHPVLRNFSLSIPANKCTAIIGRSGSGKSTLAALLVKLYPTVAPAHPYHSHSHTHSHINPQHTNYSHPIPSSTQTNSNPKTGTTTISNLPLSQIHTLTLRTKILLVPQSPTIFPTSVAENLTYGLPYTSPLRHPLNLHRAARMADIHDFILDLPLGYETVITGELGGSGDDDNNYDPSPSSLHTPKQKGNNKPQNQNHTPALSLSGGQAQRLSLARALVHRPQVLVLDEVTANLDSTSAAMVIETVRGLVRRGRDTGRGRGVGGGVLGGVDSGLEMEGRGQVGMTVVMITHSRDVVRMAADYVVDISGGRVCGRGVEEVGRW